MKKVALLSLIIILLAVMVSPAMAGNGHTNGQGNGANSGQGNNGGNGDQVKQHARDRDRDQDQDQLHNGDSSPSPGPTRNGHQEHMRVRTPFYLQGTISPNGIGAGTLTVTLIHGNARVKQYLGTDLSLVVTEGTQIFQITQGDGSDDGTSSNRIPITFNQLEVGQKVAIHGNLVNSVFTARLITVYIQTGTGEPVNPEP